MSCIPLTRVGGGGVLNVVHGRSRRPSHLYNAGTGGINTRVTDMIDDRLSKPLLNLLLISTGYKLLLLLSLLQTSKVLVLLSSILLRSMCLQNVRAAAVAKAACSFVRNMINGPVEGTTDNIPILMFGQLRQNQAWIDLHHE